VERGQQGRLVQWKAPVSVQWCEAPL
jgi:hypothetical protein